MPRLYSDEHAVPRLSETRRDGRLIGFHHMPATLELENLEVRLAGRLILDGLSGTLQSRAIGLLGPNGSGKTTLINTLIGFHQVARRAARVLGYHISTCDH